MQTLASGHDFFASPALSPDGQQLAWLTWDHPCMPWDGTTLWLAQVLPDGSLADTRAVAGSDNESIFQPSWSPHGELHFASDRNGFWNLYRLDGDKVLALHPMQAECGQPQWTFGMSSYGFDDQGRIVCCFRRNGKVHLALLNGPRFDVLDLPFVAIEGLQVGPDFAVFVGATPHQPNAVVRLDLATGSHEVLRSSNEANVSNAFIAQAEAITFPTAQGQHQAHAFFYPPTSASHEPPADEKPPLIVVCHGGPTAASDAGLKLSHQFWTSRGFAVVDVNYRGSTGYGRAYRELLDGHWGVADVEDCINAARFLIERGDVDARRLVIRGSSAGGYTTLCALTFHRFFHAGASLYGIGDLKSLIEQTHKFEARYLDRLIGPYPAAAATYRERSPIHFVERLSSPMILFQGSEDKAVPPAQAQAMFDAVKSKGLPVAYLLFEGEQHGFRRASTIQRALEAELYFYGQVFGFVPADPIEPVAIENLPPSRCAV